MESDGQFNYVNGRAQYTIGCAASHQDFDDEAWPAKREGMLENVVNLLTFEDAWAKLWNSACINGSAQIQIHLHVLP